MSKAEMLMEYATQDIVSWIMEEEQIPMEEALDRFYSSVTFEKLTDPETGLYLDSPASVYWLYKDECIAGKFIQREM